VRRARDGRPILREVSLTVRAGEHWALLGANGAGKSTLLGLLGARTHPSRGSVDVLGRRLGRVDVRELRTYVGHVDPRHPLGEPLRLRDVVLTGVTNSLVPLPRWRPTAQQERRADDLIGTLGLAALRGARWPTLSQGQRGRTLIARALMPEPRAAAARRAGPGPGAGRRGAHGRPGREVLRPAAGAGAARGPLERADRPASVRDGRRAGGLADVFRRPPCAPRHLFR
jgi:ABC-type hemin transport system ATPase subunit